MRIYHFLWALLLTVTSQELLCQKKPTTLIVVMIAARNDLYPYARRHIKQLQDIGSNDHTKIFIRLDHKKPGEPAGTEQFFIENGAIKHVGSQEMMDSGDEKSLIQTVKTAHTLFPADELVLVVSNHGSGGLEPDVQKVLNPSELFRYNSKKGLIELERRTGYMEYITRGNQEANHTKGICFDDHTANYLTTKKFTRALEVISKEVLKKKIKILACDACLMAGLDVIPEFQPYVHYFIGSQEVILGTGYKYDSLLRPLLNGTVQCDETLACHFVDAFEEAYEKITADYTHSTIDLTHIDKLSHNFDSLAQCLLVGLKLQKTKSVKKAIRLSRHKNFCTRFKEPTYIDIGNFYENMLKNYQHCQLESPADTKEFKKNLSLILTEGLALMKHIIKANAVGKNLKKATGLSIYFPEYVIHKSYFYNAFAQEKTRWLNFLKKYIITH